MDIRNYFAKKQKKIQGSESEPNLQIPNEIASVDNSIANPTNVEIDKAGPINLEEITTECVTTGNVLNETILAMDLGTLQSGPSQPVLKTFPLSPFSGNRLRAFNAEYYYDRFPDLEYSVEKDAVFCFACRMFPSNKYSAGDTFTKIGEHNWKKIGEKLTKHYMTESHIFSTEKLSNFRIASNSGSILNNISSEHEKFLTENRVYLEKLVNILIYLAKQGCALRGHDETDESTNQGNFIELCKLFGKFDICFQSKLDSHINYISYKIQNELLEICADYAVKEIINEIHSAGFYSLIVDEVKCHKNELLSICIRYVKGLSIVERFLCFSDCSSDRTANGLYKIISEKLESLSIYKIPILSQAYDGASVMSGDNTGLQTRILADHKFAQYIHCFAHKLNLILVQSCTSLKSASNFFDCLQAVYCIFSEPYAHDLLRKLQSNLQISTEIFSLSQTRWAYRYKATKAVFENYDEILDALDIIYEGKSSQRMTARGVKLSIISPEFLICLIIFNKILPLIHVAHKAFQSSNINISQALETIESLITEFNILRTNLQWSNLWDQYQNFANNEAETSTRPKRNRKPPAFEGFSVEINLPTCNSNDNSNYYKVHIYFEIIDRILFELNRRFKTDSMIFFKAISSILNVECENENISFFKIYSQHFNFDYDLALAEMKIVSNTMNSSHKLLFDILNRIIHPNFYKMVQIALSIPIGSVSCERSNSSLRRISSFTRTTMAENRLSNLAILHIEKELAAHIPASAIIDIFSERKERRMMLK